MRILNARDHRLLTAQPRSVVGREAGVLGKAPCRLGTRCPAPTLWVSCHIWERSKAITEQQLLPRQLEGVTLACLPL